MGILLKQLKSYFLKINCLITKRTAVKKKMLLKLNEVNSIKGQLKFDFNDEPIFKALSIFNNN